MKKKIIIISVVLICLLILSFFIPVKTEIKEEILYEHPYDDGGETQHIKVYYNIWSNPIPLINLVFN